jgi:hypothetical protein
MIARRPCRSRWLYQLCPPDIELMRNLQFSRAPAIPKTSLDERRERAAPRHDGIAACLVEQRGASAIAIVAASSFILSRCEWGEFNDNKTGIASPRGRFLGSGLALGLQRSEVSQRK